MKIFKKPIANDNTPTEIDVPKDAVILHGDYQDHLASLAVWFSFENSHDLRRVQVIFLGTGRELDGDGWRFVNTFLMRTQKLVFHVYERTVPA